MVPSRHGNIRDERIDMAELPIPADIDTALPSQVARVLGTTEAGLAQMRYRGTGPKFCKVAGGRKVLYRWSDVRAYLDANTVQRTDEPRGVGVA
jgi:hypothetical protein